jgi:hypothetical protein
MKYLHKYELFKSDKYKKILVSPETYDENKIYVKTELYKIVGKIRETSQDFDAHRYFPVYYINGYYLENKNRPYSDSKYLPYLQESDKVPIEHSGIRTWKNIREANEKEIEIYNYYEKQFKYYKDIEKYNL